MNIGCYMLRNTQTDQKYIGLSKNLYQRIRQHALRIKTRDAKLEMYSDLNLDNTEISIFKTGIEHISDFEIFLIWYYKSDRNNGGYNQDLGGCTFHGCQNDFYSFFRRYQPLYPYLNKHTARNLYFLGLECNEENKLKYSGIELERNFIPEPIKKIKSESKKIIDIEYFLRHTPINYL